MPMWEDPRPARDGGPPWWSWLVLALFVAGIAYWALNLAPGAP